MALYTLQQLVDAYLEASNANPSEVGPGYLAAKAIEVQAQIDDRIDNLTTRKAEVISRGTERVNEIQTRIDNIEPDAKTHMKNIALRHLAAQAANQSENDNIGVNL